MTALLTIDGATVAREGRDVVRELSLRCSPGTVTGLLGPNGSGKSSLLRAMIRALSLREGSVQLGDDDLADLSRRRLAQHVGSLTQDQERLQGISVRDVVGLGALARVGDFGQLGSGDHDAIDEAIELLDMGALSETDCGHLSGGERQRMHVARVLAQQTGVLLLDEPANHLDVGHQHRLLADVRDLAVDRNLVVLIAMHDLALAARWCDAVAVLDKGDLQAHGAPREVLTEELVSGVFGVRHTWWQRDDAEHLVILGSA